MGLQHNPQEEVIGTGRQMLFPPGQYDEKEYEDVLKTVRLQISKRTMKQEPLFENAADADSKDYYDVSVLIEMAAESLEDGEEVFLQQR